MQRALFFILALSSIGCASKETTTTDSGGSGEAPDGAAVFVASCAPCHGPDGDGVGSSPSIKDRVRELSDSELAGIIENGTGTMLPPNPELTNAEADAVFLYVRETFGQEGGA